MALSSRQVELSLVSSGDHRPLATRFPCSTIYLPYPVALASEYATLTADGLGQICLPLKFVISLSQNSISWEASPDKVNLWHQASLRLRTAYKLRVISR